MVVKQRTGWGYETLVREVSDSLHLRRFCLIGIDQRVPDESTVRKLARRLGASVVREITRMVIEKARRDRLGELAQAPARACRRHPMPWRWPIVADAWPLPLALPAVSVNTTDSAAPLLSAFSAAAGNCTVKEVAPPA